MLSVHEVAAKEGQYFPVFFVGKVDGQLYVSQVERFLHTIKSFITCVSFLSHDALFQYI
jgi:hypothetical protein